MKRARVRPEPRQMMEKQSPSRPGVKPESSSDEVVGEQEPVFYCVPESIFGSTSTIDDVFYRQAIAGRLRR